MTWTQKSHACLTWIRPLVQCLAQVKKGITVPTRGLPAIRVCHLGEEWEEVEKCFKPSLKKVKEGFLDFRVFVSLDFELTPWILNPWASKPRGIASVPWGWGHRDCHPCFCLRCHGKFVKDSSVWIGEVEDDSLCESWKNSVMAA